MYNEEDFSPESLEEMGRWPWQFRWGLLIGAVLLLVILIFISGC